MGNCRYCGRAAGFVRRKHAHCQKMFDEGRQRVVTMTSRAAEQVEFDESLLMRKVKEIAQNSRLGEEDIRAAIAEGWCRAVRESLADGIVTVEEEVRLREFRDRMAVDRGESSVINAWLDEGIQARLLDQGCVAALANKGESTLEEFSAALARSPWTWQEQKLLTAQAWEAATARAIEDGVLSLDEEHALIRYLRHFDLAPGDVDQNGAHQSMVQAAIIREAAEGVVPDRIGRVQGPFNLMKSEQLVWVFDDVDYLELKVRRERRGMSHGLSIRVAKSLYYRPDVIRSRPIEREETVHEDTGLLGVTNKHIYFAGSRKRFRIRFDRIVSFDAYDDGLGVMRDAQSASPQTFVTGDGWFIYNLVSNLAGQG